jgi:hypothetical protein
MNREREVEMVDSYSIEETDVFDGIGGRYKLIRVTTGGYGRPVQRKVELYRVRDDGLEVFLGYVPMVAWHRRLPCARCGAGPHQRCWAVGRVTSLGDPMQSVHACRKPRQARSSHHPKLLARRYRG